MGIVGSFCRACILANTLGTGKVRRQGKAVIQQGDKGKSDLGSEEMQTHDRSFGKLVLSGFYKTISGTVYGSLE